MNSQPRAHRVGTHAWSLCTNGQLTAAERRHLVPAVIAVQVRNVVGRLAIAAHVDHGRRREVDLDRLVPPTTTFTRVAEAHAATHLSPAILNHSLRTYAFGAALAAVDGVEVDHELLYAAALLHDVALREGAGDGIDFTVASAAVALQIADDIGLPPTAAETVASAITLHYSPDVGFDDGPVAYLLSAGAALDVIGQRTWDLPPSTVAAIVDQHTRSGFKREFARAFRGEAA
jgi:hypothetical protein